MDQATVLADAGAVWRDEITPTLHDYIAIPALSPALDADWDANGHIARAVDLVADWCRARPIAGLTVDVAELPDHTPLIVMDIPALRRRAGRTTPCSSTATSTSSRRCTAGVTGPTVDAGGGGRPPLRAWADDGYAAFASLAAIEAVQRAGGAHARCLVLVEASEESGSPTCPPTWRPSPSWPHAVARVSASTRAATTTSGSG